MKKAFAEKQPVVENYVTNGVVTSTHSTRKFVLTNKSGKFFVRFGKSNRYVELQEAAVGFTMTVEEAPTENQSVASA